MQGLIFWIDREGQQIFFNLFSFDSELKLLPW